MSKVFAEVPAKLGPKDKLGPTVLNLMMQVNNLTKYTFPPLRIHLCINFKNQNFLFSSKAL